MILNKNISPTVFEWNRKLVNIYENIWTITQNILILAKFWIYDIEFMQRTLCGQFREHIIVYNNELIITYYADKYQHLTLTMYY